MEGKAELELKAGKQGLNCLQTDRFPNENAGQ